MSQVSITKIGEGVSHIVVRMDLMSEGLAELDHEVVLSPSDLVPVRENTAPAFRIAQAWFGLVWFDVVLGFGTLQPRPVWTLARDTCSHVDFRCFGGLRDYDTAPPSDKDGKLWLSTNGFSTAGSQGHIILELRKLAP